MRKTHSYQWLEAACAPEATNPEAGHTPALSDLLDQECSSAIASTVTTASLPCISASCCTCDACLHLFHAFISDANLLC